MSKYRKHKSAKKPFIDYNKKIKRHNNRIYSFDKAAVLKKVTTIGGLVLLLGGFVFAGFFIMPPFLKLINGDSVENTVPWTPPETEDVDTTPPDTEQTATTEPPAPVRNNGFGGNVVLADSSVLANADTLAAYLENVKADGYTGVVIELKNSTGEIWYNTTNSLLAANPDAYKKIVKGKLTLAEIVMACNDAGLRPAAKIWTLKDQLATRAVKSGGLNLTYKGAWFGTNKEYWADAAKKNTSLYLGEIAKEIASAGFDNIVLSGLQFPKFKVSSYSGIEGIEHIKDTSGRYIYLGQVLTA
ncbi:MAG: putative glycoside hydrolase, partial [Oscillospiraceae bacterium]|nr:putative glycoside hydrolase [Oscillospiraceae bacterium]